MKHVQSYGNDSKSSSTQICVFLFVPTLRCFSHSFAEEGGKFITDISTSLESAVVPNAHTQV